MQQQFLRRTLKGIPFTGPTVRAARWLWRKLRTKQLLTRHPEGGFLTCHGVRVFCDFRKEAYAWYDGPSANLEFDQQVIRSLVDQSEGNVFIDVGAHFGFFTAWLAELTQNAKLLAMEPDRENFECLKQTMSVFPDEQTVLLQQAISDEDGVVNLYATDASCLHSYPEDESRVAYQTQCTSLDSLVATHCDEADKVALIKIDVDGAEPLLFSGGKKTFENHRPLVFMEFAPFHLRRFGVDLRQYFSELCDRFYVYWIVSRPSWQVRRVGPGDLDEIKAAVGSRVTDFVLSPSELCFSGITNGK